MALKIFSKNQVMQIQKAFSQWKNQRPVISDSQKFYLFNSKQADKMKEVFPDFDLGGGNFATYELEKLMKQVGDEAEITKLQIQLDPEEKGTIGYSKFMDVVFDRKEKFRAPRRKQLIPEEPVAPSEFIMSQLMNDAGAGSSSSFLLNVMSVTKKLQSIETNPKKGDGRKVNMFGVEIDPPAIEPKAADSETESENSSSSSSSAASEKNPENENQQIDKKPNEQIEPPEGKEEASATAEISTKEEHVENKPDEQIAEPIEVPGEPTALAVKQKESSVDKESEQMQVEQIQENDFDDQESEQMSEMEIIKLKQCDFEVSTNKSRLSRYSEQVDPKSLADQIESQAQQDLAPKTAPKNQGQIPIRGKKEAVEASPSPPKPAPVMTFALALKPKKKKAPAEQAPISDPPPETKSIIKPPLQKQQSVNQLTSPKNSALRQSTTLKAKSIELKLQKQLKQSTLSNSSSRKQVEENKKSATSSGVKKKVGSASRKKEEAAPTSSIKLKMVSSKKKL